MHSKSAFLLVYLLCTGDGYRVRKSHGGIREGEESHALTGLPQMAHALVELEQSQIDKGKTVFNPLQGLALLLLSAGRTSAGWQLGARPAGRPLSIDKQMGPRIPFGDHRRSASYRSRASILSSMQGNSDDEVGAEVFDAGSDKSGAAQGAGAAKGAGATKRVKVKQWSTVEQKRFNRVLDSLKGDAIELFSREPDWDNFASDFRLIESTGDVVEGLGPIKMTLELLRKIRNRVAIEEDVDIKFNLIVSGPLDKKVVVARWKVKLGLDLPDAPGESVIEAETKIHFNDENQVDYIQINKWNVTGELLASLQPLESLLGEKESVDRAAYLKRVRMWAMELKEMNETNPLVAVPNAAEKMVKEASDLAGTFISSEIQYLSRMFVQAGLLGGVSDAISQVIDGDVMNMSHVEGMGLSAAVLSGLFDTVWLQALERDFPGTNFAAVLKKTAADFAIGGTLFNSMYLVFVPLLAASFDGMYPGADHLLDGWTMEKFIDAMSLELVTFTPYDLVAFRVVPPKFRPLAAAVVTGIYTIFLSAITRAGILPS